MADGVGGFGPLSKLAELILRCDGENATATGLVTRCLFDCHGIEDLDKATRFIVRDLEIAIRGKTVILRPMTAARKAEIIAIKKAHRDERTE